MEMTKNVKEEKVTPQAQKLHKTTNERAEAKRELAKKLTWLRDKDRELVKGIFRFHECPGGNMSFCYKAYDGDDVERYDFVDGQVYTIPLGVAKHLNKNIWYPEYDYVKGEPGVQNGFGGSQAMRATKKVRRCSFQSLEFIDIEEVPTNVSPIITVEHI